MTTALSAAARICIVEDHKILRSLLEELIERTDGFEVGGCCESAEAALELLQEAPTELALIDVALPGKSGIELVRDLQERCPDVLCVMLSGHLSSGYVEDARRSGAKAYVAKGQVGELVAVLRDVLQGGSRFPSF